MSKKIEISGYDLRKIADGALRVFHETRFLPDDSKDTQVFLVLNSFHSFLVSQGIEPNFTVKPVREENDGTPLDDLG